MTLTTLLVWVAIGLNAGWLAGEATRGHGFGPVGNVIVGLIGAMVGGFLAQALFNVDATNGLTMTALITTFVGAVLFTVVMSLLAGRRAREGRLL